MDVKQGTVRARGLIWLEGYKNKCTQEVESVFVSCLSHPEVDSFVDYYHMKPL